MSIPNSTASAPRWRRCAASRRLPPPPPDRLAAPVATLLIVLGCVLTPVSVLAVWTANQVSDTSRYIANMEPLIHTAIQNALTNKVTTQITSHLNVAGSPTRPRPCWPARA